MNKKRIPQSLTLLKAKMISYSQVFAGERPSFESLIGGIPTDEAVEWCSYIVFKKDNLKIGESDIHILAPLLFSFDSELQHMLTDYLGGFYNGVDMLIDRYSFLRLIILLITFMTILLYLLLIKFHYLRPMMVKNCPSLRSGILCSYM